VGGRPVRPSLPLDISAGILSGLSAPGDINPPWHPVIGNPLRPFVRSSGRPAGVATRSSAMTSRHVHRSYDGAERHRLTVAVSFDFRAETTRYLLWKCYRRRISWICRVLQFLQLNPFISLPLTFPFPPLPSLLPSFLPPSINQSINLYSAKAHTVSNTL